MTSMYAATIGPASRIKHLSTSYLIPYIAEEIKLIGSVRSGYPVEGAAALGFRVRILRSSSGMK